MPARHGAAHMRDIDFSAVGKAGRRTGITLPQQRLDEHGLEELSHLFSSPKKPSPLKNFVLAPPSIEEETVHTPQPAPSTHKAFRVSVPRSASPRKSGISGSAKRTSGLDIRSAKKVNERVEEHAEPEEQENAPPSSPHRANHGARRFSPASAAKAPLRDITSRNTPVQRHYVPVEDEEEVGIEEYIVPSVENSYQDETPQAQPRRAACAYEDDGVAPLIDDYDDAPGEVDEDDIPEVDGLTEALPAVVDDEDIDQSFAPEPATAQNMPNSRRKRKSDFELPDTSPAPKRARKEQAPAKTHEGKAPVREQSHEQPASSRSRQAAPNAKTREPLQKKSMNSKMSARQQVEVEEVIDRIKARPGKPKNLFVLRRETPADDAVTHTRSGRVSFKPLAYWRNERCVWGDSPTNAGIKDGARFPLNSVREIIRTEEVEAVDKPKKKGKKAKGAGSRAQAAKPEDSYESEFDDDRVDPYAEEWETERGIFRGPVAVWDAETQAPLEEEEEIDIAYAPAAIQTTEVRNSNQSQADQPSFRYSKLLGNEFMGVGLVDLPPGGIKRPKNSRKMHMSFYVVQGRVTVNMGMNGTDGNRFSIGKGGFWQVPRGNAYSIENELEKPARIFFSQGCEVEVSVEA